jgi:hypothetical protein
LRTASSKKAHQSFQVTSLAQLARDRNYLADIAIMTLIHDIDTKLLSILVKIPPC